MDFLKNASVKNKFALLLLIPLASLLFFESIALKRHLQDISSLEHVVDLAELSAMNSALAHELQKERGMSAGFLGSKGAKFADALPKQRKLTDSRLAEWKNWLESHDYQGDDRVLAELASAANGLKKLAGIRSGVSAQSLPLSEVLKFYTGNIRHLLVVPAYATEYTENGELSRLLQAYYNFLQGKERAGIERAVLSNTFAADRFAPGLFARFVDLVSGQTAFFNNYLLFADDKALTQYNRFKVGTEQAAVEKYRETARENFISGGFGVEASVWFAASTDRINQLKNLEDDFRTDMVDHAKQLVFAATTRMWSSVLMACAIIALTVLTGWWISNLMYRQIRSLSDSMQLAGNELRLDTRCEIVMKDELGQSAVALNEMLANISGLVRNLDDTSHELELISIQNHCTVSLSSKGMMVQQQESEKVVVGVSQLEQATREIAANIQNVADQSGQAGEVAESSSQVVGHSVERIRDLDQHMTQVSSTIQELHESSGAIGGVLNVIKSIAEQTNLLALNAAIEAARAGEQGRGFAVVADEVRTLAQRTQESTAEIESIIGKFQQESEAAFQAVEHSKSAVEENVSMSGELDKALASIRTAISDIQNLSDQVAAAAEEQVATNQELAEAMRNIHNIAEHTVATSEFMRKTSKTQRELAKELNDKADQFVVSA